MTDLENKTEVTKEESKAAETKKVGNVSVIEKITNSKGLNGQIITLSGIPRGVTETRMHNTLNTGRENIGYLAFIQDIIYSGWFLRIRNYNQQRGASYEEINMLRAAESSDQSITISGEIRGESPNYELSVTRVEFKNYVHETESVKFK
jgi:hypothetical protein